MNEAARAPHLDPGKLAQFPAVGVKLDKVLPLFLRSAGECLRCLEEAVRDNNLLAWQQAAHKLKGSALSITARRMGELCLEAEEIRALPDGMAEAVLYHMHKELTILRGEITNVLGAPPRG